MSVQTCSSRSWEEACARLNRKPDARSCVWRACAWRSLRTERRLAVGGREVESPRATRGRIQTPDESGDEGRTDDVCEIESIEATLAASFSSRALSWASSSSRVVLFLLAFLPSSILMSLRRERRSLVISSSAREVASSSFTGASSVEARRVSSGAVRVSK